MSKPKRLPRDVFSDSPLRSTTRLSPVPAEAEQSNSDEAPASVASPSVEVPAATTKEAGPRLVKRTIYVPEDVLQALEDEVYRRRKGGERTFDIAALQRDILAQWVASKARRAQKDASSASRA